MGRSFWQIENANSYAALVTSLNGRFRGLSSRSKRVFDNCGDFDLSRNPAAKIMIIMIVAIIMIGTLAHWEEFRAAAIQLKSFFWGRAYTIIGISLMLINIAALLWRFSLVIKYRPVKSCPDKLLPACTVIMPAYNEGRQVLRTLRSISRSDFPIDKLQIIAVDDGSKDNTWYWIEKAARELSGRIETIKMPKNGGKRLALYEGFKRSRGEIIITIDSDCLIEPQTLRRLVSPFHTDHRIGAVAGNIRVLNRHEGIIPRMLAVSFAYCFEFVRAAESMFGSVFCVAGALAAYRREPLMKVMDNWLNQKFFGYSANIGEDRALTNWILRTGWQVRFQCSAVAYTNVPINYEGLCRMLLRWGRSNVRETIAMAAFIFGKFRKDSMLCPRINFMLTASNLIIQQMMLAGLLLCILWRPDIFVMQMLFGATITACVPAAFYAVRHKSSNALWAFAQNIFGVVALSWIMPYSIFTCCTDRWLTREITDTETSQAAVISNLARSAA